MKDDFPNLDAIFDEKAIDKATRIAKMSAALKGKKMGPPSEETRAKMSASLKGRKHGPPSEETKTKLSAVMKCKVKSEEHKAKVCAAMQSAETRAKMSASQKGRKQSEEASAKMRATIAAQPRLACPHCGKTMKPTPYTRFHGDNCKDRKA
jgi:hypothetical protein